VGRGEPSSEQSLATRTNRTATSRPFLELDRVSLSYGPIQAVQHVSLQFHNGRVLSLVGDNGAGKSTIVKLITGLLVPAEGRVLLDGQPVRGWCPSAARKAGIETVFQTKALAPKQAASLNVFLGREAKDRFGFVRVRWQETETARLLAELGYTRHGLATRPVGGLSGGEQQGIAIGRASYFGASMLILDEPTTGLSLRQSKHVLEIVAATKEKGLAILFISHNIFDAVEVADDVAVLDRGVVVNQYLKSDITALSLMEFMENTAAGRGG